MHRDVAGPRHYLGARLGTGHRWVDIAENPEWLDLLAVAAGVDDALRRDWRENCLDAFDAICGVGESDHTRASGRNAVEIGAQAVERALADAGI